MLRESKCKYCGAKPEPKGGIYHVGYFKNGSRWCCDKCFHEGKTDYKLGEEVFFVVNGNLDGTMIPTCQKGIIKKLHAWENGYVLTKDDKPTQYSRPISEVFKTEKECREYMKPFLKEAMILNRAREVQAVLGNLNTEDLINLELKKLLKELIKTL